MGRVSPLLLPRPGDVAAAAATVADPSPTVSLAPCGLICPRGRRRGDLEISLVGSRLVPLLARCYNAPLFGAPFRVSYFGSRAALGRSSRPFGFPGQMLFLVG